MAFGWRQSCCSRARQFTWLRVASPAKCCLSGVQGLLLLLLFSVLMSFAVVRGGHGASIADITCGSFEYWVSLRFGLLACWRWSIARRCPIKVLHAMMCACLLVPAAAGGGRHCVHADLHVHRQLAAQAPATAARGGGPLHRAWRLPDRRQIFLPVRFGCSFSVRYIVITLQNPRDIPARGHAGWRRRHRRWIGQWPPWIDSHRRASLQVFQPLLLEMGMHPRVLHFTLNFMVASRPRRHILGQRCFVAVVVVAQYLFSSACTMVLFYIIGALQINYAIWSTAGWLGWLAVGIVAVATGGACRFWFIAFIFGLHGHQFFAGNNSRRHVACALIAATVVFAAAAAAVAARCCFSYLESLRLRG